LALALVARWLQHTNPALRVKCYILIGDDCHVAFDAAYTAIKQALSSQDPAIRKAASNALRARSGFEGMENVIDIYTDEAQEAWDKEDGRIWQTTVKVVDESGGPIRKAEVWIPRREKRAWESANPSGSSARWAVFGRTDENGNFEFRDLGWTGRDVSIHARKDGYIPASAKCLPPDLTGGTTVTIPVEKRVVPATTLVLKRQ